MKGCWPLVIQLFFPCGKRGGRWQDEHEERPLKLLAGKCVAGFFGSSGFRPTEVTEICMCGIF